MTRLLSLLSASLVVAAVSLPVLAQAAQIVA